MGDRDPQPCGGGDPMPRAEHSAKHSRNEMGSADPALFTTRLDFKKIDEEFLKEGRPCLPLDREFEGESFSLPMPPPNITGKLHLGHALDLGLQDALIRWHGSKSSRISWIAGCDHAGLATHEKIMLAEPGLSWESESKRSDYLLYAKGFADEMRASILGQFERLGPLADLSMPRFTLDAGYQEECKHALSKLISKGRIHASKDGKLWLDLSMEARELAQALSSGEIEIQPKEHLGRLLSMLNEERLWEIGREHPWGIQAELEIDKSGRAIGFGQRNWTLDCWFNSAIWPQAIEGGGHIFDALIIGYDISFFWGARMAMMSKALGHPWPFRKMMLHGLIRDSSGRKFSKSLGNGIDPLEIMDSKGMDALRLWCCQKAAWGADFKWNPAEIESGSKWLTKIANACRLLEMRKPSTCKPIHDGSLAWPIGFESEGQEFERLFKLKMSEMRLDQAAELLRDFGRSAWCEGWLGKNAENLAQPKIWHQACSGQRRLLALAHPFAPASTWHLDGRMRKLLG